MNVKLVNLNRGSDRQEILLESFPVVLGRSDSADVSIANRLISRRHCEIRWHENRLIVRDLNSSLGTLVDLREVDEAEITPGATLTIGPISYRVVYHKPSWLTSIRKMWSRPVASPVGSS